MAYEVFADFYDTLNEDADYDALFGVLRAQLLHCGIRDGIVADLGCGTGELTLRLAEAGYDMIAVDCSTEMLCILREKAAEAGHSDILLLNQDLTQLDLYGTVRAAVCTFDTLNHIGPLAQFQKAVALAALFLEPGCPFIFDMNTPYKHEAVLADNTFIIETDDAVCEWNNAYDAQNMRTQITIAMRNDGGELFHEKFYEYSYSYEQIETACADAGLRIERVQDGENFGVLNPESERFLITAIRV
ncbi:MAG: class I SAM-dependent methyltransferase [Ruthenibacterium sp.]